MQKDVKKELSSKMNNFPNLQGPWGPSKNSEDWACSVVLATEF